MKEELVPAAVGSWIKDLSANRSLGFVLQVDYNTGMMLVSYPKIGSTQWAMHKNLGQYRVINK